MFAAQEGSSEPPNSMEPGHVVTPLAWGTLISPGQTSKVKKGLFCDFKPGHVGAIGLT